MFADGLERAKGIEPSYAAWEAAVLPLNYARLVFFEIRHFLHFLARFRLVHVANRVAPFQAHGSSLIARSHAVRQAARPSSELCQCPFEFSQQGHCRVFGHLNADFLDQTAGGESHTETQGHHIAVPKACAC
jgi:hypothetical protein